MRPDLLVQEVDGWQARGAQVIGTCCGMGPEYTKALRARLP
jgi:S-methylmethionine-dependent homocysteine/selenocysteine methylase